MSRGKLGLIALVLVGAAACGDAMSSEDASSPAMFEQEGGDNTKGKPPGNPGGPSNGAAGSGFNSGAGATYGAAAGSGTYSPGAGGSGAFPPPGSAGGGGATGEAGGASAGGAAGEAGAGGEAGSGGAAVCPGVDLGKPTTLYLSADDSNSMASPALARSLINRGGTPDPWMIRPYEFLNYYNVAYEAPAAGTLRFVPQMRPGKKEGEYDLQIGVQAPPVEVRRRVALTLVLDTSGSMDGEPIKLQQASARAIASQLNEGDIVSITTWNTGTNVALSGHTVKKPDDPELLAVIDSLTAGGGTDLHQGLVNGYKLAKEHYSEDRMNRVVVISDGVANVGVTDEQMIGAEADVENKEGIYLVGIGVGAGVNDTLLNVVTDAGNGAYLFIDSAEEAQRMLAGRFDEVMEIAARDVRVSMTMPSYLSIVKFSGEQYSTDPAKVKPQNLAPGDAMVISQTLRACSPGLVQPGDGIEFRATWTEPGLWQPRMAEHKTTVGELLEQGDAELRRGLAIVAYADALKKGVGCKDRKTLVGEAQTAADKADPGKADPALNEIRGLLDKFGKGCP